LSARGGCRARLVLLRGRLRHAPDAYQYPAVLIRGFSFCLQATGGDSTGSDEGPKEATIVDGDEPGETASQRDMCCR